MTNWAKTFLAVSPIVSKSLIVFFMLIIAISECDTREKEECVLHEGRTKCHESCLECNKQSLCEDPNACIRCKEKEYKIAPNSSSEIFQCSPTCEDISFPIDDYSWCMIPEGSYQIIEFLNYKIKRGVTPIPTLYPDYKAIVIPCSGAAILVSGGLFFVGYQIFKTRRAANKLSFSRQPDVEKGLIKPAEKKPIIKIDEDNQTTNEKIYSNLEIISDASEFKRNKEFIGGGNYSRVYEGTLRNKPVAIKVALKEGRKSVHTELRIYDKISHPNIVKPLGIHLAVENVMFMPLRKYNLAVYFEDYEQNLTSNKLTTFCIQIADGLKYLHSKNIIHCDLKIDNILVKDEKAENVEICDFGCALDLDHDDCNKFLGTATHTSYELLKKCYHDSNFQAKASKSSDVWAYAVTAWQIFSKTHKLPKDFQIPKEIVENYEKGKKLPKPSLISEGLWRYVILRCFDLEPGARPSMEEVHYEFKKYDRE